MSHHAEMSTLLVLAAALSGCAVSRATFLRTTSVRMHPPTRPGVYVDRLPKKPFAPVGFIVVESPAAPGADRSSRVSHASYFAMEKGAELGCDVVVERSLIPKDQFQQKGATLPSPGRGVLVAYDDHHHSHAPHIGPCFSRPPEPGRHYWESRPAPFKSEPLVIRPPALPPVSTAFVCGVYLDEYGVPPYGYHEKAPRDE